MVGGVRPTPPPKGWTGAVRQQAARPHALPDTKGGPTVAKLPGPRLDHQQRGVQHAGRQQQAPQPVDQDPVGLVNLQGCLKVEVTTVPQAATLLVVRERLELSNQALCVEGSWGERA